MKDIIKSMVWKAVLAFAVIFVLAAAVSALSIPPVVQISATPNPASVTSTIAAVAVDLSGSGIAWVKVYEDGVKVKECSTSTCVYVAVHPSAGIHSYYAKTSDNGGREATSSTTNIVFTNAAPVLNPIGERNVTNETLLQFSISGYDYNNDALTYSTGALPAGAVFNAGTRTFSWTPTTAQIGTYTVNFSVSDGYLSDSEVVTINVVSDYVNYAPVLGSVGDKAVNETQLLQFTISATDANGDTLTYSTGALPSGATFNAGTRTFSWTPTNSQAGTYNVHFSVSDGLLADSEVITITVVDYSNGTNQAPVLDAIGNKALLEGQLLQFSVNATDANGDILTYSASGLPSGATFNITTRVFSWIPSFVQAGTYNVNFSVSDGLLADSEVITITVTDAVDNDAPEYSNLITSPVSPAGYSENGTFSFNSTWTDNFAVVGVWIEFNGVNYSASNNGDVYSFSVNALPRGNYSYRWFAVDMAGNYNSTSTFVYEVVKGTPSLSIEMLPSSSVSNGTQTNVTGLGCPSQLTCTLYRNGVEVNNTDVQTLGLGEYTYIFNTTGNENYSSASVSRTLRVTAGGSDDDDDDDDNDDIIVIDDNDFTNGISSWMSIGDKLKFMFCGAPYYLKLKDIDFDDEKVYLQLTPSLMNFILEEDEREEVDLNGDGIKDLLIKVEKVEEERAKIYIKRLSNVCTSPEKTDSTLVTVDSGVIGAKSSSVSIWNSLSIFFLLGIMLLLLAILLWILLGMKRKRRTAPGNGH